MKIYIRCNAESSFVTVSNSRQKTEVIDLLDESEGFTIESIDGNNIYYSINYDEITEDDAESILNEIDMIIYYGD